ncbi:unnamed protein product [Echinostoma caproni]|uniref:HECT domain-containing protein n=1 Tax=Echinostoma caproni TaxID=27848 RepID=A0A183APG1_9TREM|nr:unnamed protein product [Echinostoma caproni]
MTRTITPLLDNTIGLLGQMLIKGAGNACSNSSDIRQQGVAVIHLVIGCVSGVLNAANEGPGRELHLERPLASFVLSCLRHVNWDDRVKQDELNWTYTVENQTTLPHPCPADPDSQSQTATFAGSLTFLCMLLTQSLCDSAVETKASLQQLIELILSSFDVSTVGERYYTFILSNMDELQLPAHCVLMPPTSLEGRLFCLLASAGGMTASPGHAPIVHKPSDSSSSNRLYPSLDSFPPSVPRSQVHKRLCYLRKITSLLQYALLRGQIPARDVETLKAGPLLSTIAQPVASSNESLGESLFSRFLAQPMGSLFRRLRSSTVNLASTNERETEEPARILAVLCWLRIGNLLSELEAVGATSTWADPSSGEFSELTELCAEVMRLIQSGAPQSSGPVSNVSVELNAVEQRLNLLSGAIVSWILGRQGTEPGISNPPSVPLTLVPPRSIHAGLSKPICYTLLIQNTPTDQGCVAALVRVLEASIWSVLTLAPNGMSFAARFESVNNIFIYALSRHSNEAFLVSNTFTYGCLREASLLPLFYLATSRSHRFGRSNLTADGPQILLADMMHWLNTLDWKSFTLENPVKLSGLMLSISFVAHTFEMKNSTIANGCADCCTYHPAWKSVQSSDPASKTRCAVASLVKQLLNVLADVRKLLTPWKATVESDNKNSEYAVRILNLVNIIGGLLSSWLGRDSDGLQLPFEPLQRFSSASQPSNANTGAIGCFVCASTFGSLAQLHPGPGGQLCVHSSLARFTSVY